MLGLRSLGYLLLDKSIELLWSIDLDLCHEFVREGDIEVLEVVCVRHLEGCGFEGICVIFWWNGSPNRIPLQQNEEKERPVKYFNNR